MSNNPAYVFAERILNATVVIDEHAPEFVFNEFRNKVNYVLELHPVPLVMTSRRRNQLKIYLVRELLNPNRVLPPNFNETLFNIRRTGGKRRKRTRKLK